MAGLIDVGILKPELAGSFAAGYRGAEEQRNALAQRQQQAAQAEQQLASGRQRLQMDEMTMQRLQEDRAALTGLQAKLRAAGQSDDPKVFFKALTESNDPNIIMKGIEGLQRYQALEAYDREFGPRAGAPAMPSSVPNAMVAPAASEDRLGDFISQIEAKRNAPIPMPAVTGGAMGASAPVAPAFAPANALAPAAPTPTNAMAPSSAMPNIDALRRQYSMAVAAGRSDAPVLLKQIEAALKPDPSELRTMQTLGYPLTQEGYASFRAAQMKDSAPPVSIAEFERAKRDPDFMRFLQERAAAIRPPAAPRPEPAPRTQQVTMSDGTLGIVNMDTGVITPSTVGGAPVKGKPSAFAEKTQSQRAQLEKDLTTAISELKDAAKDGGLIDQSTGSGIGRGVDIGARAFGKAMPGDIAIGKLAPIADLVLKMVPRFEGPQSDKDTKSYKEAAGQLSDAGLPREIRKQAASTIVRLMENRKGQFVNKDMEAAGAAPAAPAKAGPSVSNW
tara:strand:- start:1353 stop:2861 length:1509 start_codon:yes stop_codon:yes gene_type:complete